MLLLLLLLKVWSGSFCRWPGESAYDVTPIKDTKLRQTARTETHFLVMKLEVGSTMNAETEIDPAIGSRARARLRTLPRKCVTGDSDVKKDLRAKHRQTTRELSAALFHSPESP